MKLHAVEQNSVDWQILRSGKLTASEADALVSPTGKVRNSEGVDTYLAQKLCEVWTGGPLATLNTFDMDQGRILEERAKPAFTLHTGIEIQNVGFITTDDERCGCSPDGFVPFKTGAEIKCPRLDTHAAYLISGKLPKQYVAQVQFSMFVTGLEKWHFFSYNRAFPPLHLVVHRDEEFQDAFREAVDSFLSKLDAALKRIEELNGGPPRHMISAAREETQFTSETPT